MKISEFRSCTYPEEYGIAGWLLPITSQLLHSLRKTCIGSAPLVTTQLHSVLDFEAPNNLLKLWATPPMSTDVEPANARRRRRGEDEGFGGG
jgi:hypothetical protein